MDTTLPVLAAKTFTALGVIQTWVAVRSGLQIDAAQVYEGLMAITEKNWKAKRDALLVLVKHQEQAVMTCPVLFGLQYCPHLADGRIREKKIGICTHGH